VLIIAKKFGFKYVKTGFFKKLIYTYDKMGGRIISGAAAASAYGHDDMTMATEAQSTYHHGDDMTMATHDAGFDQMVEDEISKRSGAGFA